MNWNIFLNKIEMTNTIYIYCHVLPDGDAYGSQWGLAEIIKKNWPEKKVICVGRETKDKISKFFPKCQNLSKVDKNALGIILDTHHPNIDDFSNDDIVDVDAPAVCYLIAKFVFDNNLKIDKIIATYLYIGIMTDTGRLSYGKLNSNVYKIIDKLTNVGINIRKINYELSEKTQAEAKYEGYILSKFKIKKRVAYIILPKNKHLSYNLTFDEAGSRVGLISSIKNTDFAVYSSYYSEKEFWKISVRSKGIPIDEIAKKYNGGGHERAAGASVKTKKEVKNLIKDLNKLK